MACRVNVDTKISKNDTLISLVSHMNWSAGLLTKLIKRSNSRREHDAIELPKQSSTDVPTKY
jgi:hypothetical protein